MYAISFWCWTIIRIASWKALLMWRQVMWKEKRTRGVNILFINIIPNECSKCIIDFISLRKLCNFLRWKFIIFIFFDIQHVGTTSLNEWNVVSVLCCHEKVVLIFLHLWSFGLFRNWKTSLKSSNAFWFSIISNEM